MSGCATISISQHRPPDTAGAMSDAIWHRVLPSAIGPRRKPAAQHCRSKLAMVLVVPASRVPPVANFDLEALAAFFSAGTHTVGGRSAPSAGTIECCGHYRPSATRCTNLSPLGELVKRRGSSRNEQACSDFL